MIEQTDVTKQIYNLVKDNCPPEYNPLDYVSDIVRPLAIEKANECIRACASCDICRYKIKTLFKGTGREPILIIGETAILNQEGVTFPYEGTQEGEMLNKIFTAFGVDTTKLMWINTVNCCSARTTEEGIPQKRAPTVKEARECHVFLDYIIRATEPKMIILLGNIALNAFKKDTILKAHGKLIDVKGIPAMPMYNPSYFLDMQDIKSAEEIKQDKLDLCEDMKKAFLYFDNIYPEDKIFINDNIKNIK